MMYLPISVGVTKRHLVNLTTGLIKTDPRFIRLTPVSFMSLLNVVCDHLYTISDCDYLFKSRVGRIHKRTSAVAEWYYCRHAWLRHKMAYIYVLYTLQSISKRWRRLKIWLYRYILLLGTLWQWAITIKILMKFRLHEFDMLFYPELTWHVGRGQAYIWLTHCHDDVIKWKHFPCYWPFVRGIHRSPVNSRTKASDAELGCFLWSAPE